MHERNQTKVVKIYKDSFDVYIGRDKNSNIPMLPNENGYFGNPIAKGKPCLVCGGIHRSPGDTIPCYRKYFMWRIEFDHLFAAEIEKLRGKTLGCFCKPNPCHGDVIAEYLND